MNWLGILVLGAAIGLAGCFAHPVRRARGARPPRAILAGMLAAAAAKMAGSLSGMFYDGSTLEWPACAIAALLVVTVTVAFARRRSS